MSHRKSIHVTFSASRAELKLTVLLAVILLGGCDPSNPQPTALLPTFGNLQTATVIPIPPTVEPTNEPDRVWSKRAVGASAVTISFYSANGKKCLRLVEDAGSLQPIEKCSANNASIVALQQIITDSGGQIHTVIVGRILNPKIAVVSIELDKAENTPAPLSDGGFFVVLPGKRTAISVVPIDQFGNLVGTRYLMK